MFFNHVAGRVQKMTSFSQKVLFFLSIVLLINVFGINNFAYAQTAVADLQAKYEKLAKQYLVKHPSIHDFYTITPQGIYMYASPQDKQKSKAECIIFWSEIDDFKKMMLHTDETTQLQIYLEKKNKKFSWTHKKTIRVAAYHATKSAKSPAEQPLLGKRIAIDPGHIAGDLELARIEGRIVDITHEGKNYQFCEGDLTLTTAELLAKKLTEEGAEVLITRNTPNHTTSGIPYSQWVQQELPSVVAEAYKNKLITKKQKQTALRNPMRYTVHEDFFLPIDLRERMRKINEFNPDITVVIHFNADAEKKQRAAVSYKNYSMTFVAGSFMKNELNNPEERLAFVKLLLLGNLEKSFQLARHIQEQFVQHLGVPAVPVENPLAYLNKASIFVQKGVYARNLGLCRLINSPIAYGESMYQDNIKEMKALHNNNYPHSPAQRVEEVAEAYFKGIMRYFKEVK
jgi:N-acetylmuramoyl-L-alanine amidase